MEENSLINKLKSMNEDELNRLYLRFFNNDDGRLVIQDLKNRCYFETPTVNFLGGNDPMSIGYREGMRGVILHILTTMKRPEQQEIRDVEDSI